MNDQPAIVTDNARTIVAASRLDGVVGTPRVAGGFNLQDHAIAAYALS